MTFEELWELKSKTRRRRRQRDISITVFKAENILNAGPPRPAASHHDTPLFTSPPHDALSPLRLASPRIATVRPAPGLAAPPVAW